VIGFKPYKLVHQSIEFSVGDFGIVERVVTVFVMPDFVAEGFGLLLEVFVFGCGHWENYRRESYNAEDAENPGLR
jgi:hypothetical protein